MNERLTAFLYILGRDYLPLGSIEKIMDNLPRLSLPVLYSNKQLAKYATDVAARISGEKT